MSNQVDGSADVFFGGDGYWIKTPEIDSRFAKKSIYKVTEFFENIPELLPFFNHMSVCGMLDNNDSYYLSEDGFLSIRIGLTFKHIRFNQWDLVSSYDMKTESEYFLEDYLEKFSSYGIRGDMIYDHSSREFWYKTNIKII